jgi:uncharacterized protein
VRKITKLAGYLLISLALLFSGIFLWNQKELSLVYVDQEPLVVEIADTFSEQIKGLSYREHLEPGHGMLFVLEGSEPGCMWMKEMKFNIDVYWFSKNGDIINSFENLSPESFPTKYCPAIPAEYMLEVKAGEFKVTPSKLYL